MKRSRREEIGWRVAVLVMAWCLLVPGCSGEKEGKADTASKQSAAQNPAGSAPGGPIRDISDNPNFFQSGDNPLRNADNRQLDEWVRPVLRQVLKDAVAVKETEGAGTGEAECLGIVTYVARKLFDRTDAEDLHKALRAVRFNPSPRLGKKPVGRKVIAMSFLKTGTPPKVYAVVLRMDTTTQTITVKSYVPGKMDRM